MWTVTLGTLGGVSQTLANQVIAFTQAAASFWARYVDTSGASIDIEISFAALEPGALAQGGADLFFDHSAGGFDYYAPNTIIELNTGVDTNGSDPDIYIELNASALLSGEFGFASLVDGVSTGVAGKYDLWTVILHEIGHGMGMLSLIGVDPVARSTFDEFVYGSLYFDGPNPNFGPFLLDFASVAHLDQSAGSLMSPALDPGIALYLSEAELSIFGDLGVSLIEATSGDDLLYSFGTRSTDNYGSQLRGLAGNDTINGLPTRDTLDGDEGDDSLYGAADTDILNGGEGADTLSGGQGDDFLLGGADDDSMQGGAGNDTLLAGEGADTIEGGTGIDSVSYNGSASAVFLVIGGVSSGGLAEGDVIDRVELISGSHYDDSIFGNGADNAIDGLTGFDLLSGGGGNDTLTGGVGDTLTGGAGADTFFGFNAFVSYRHSPTGVMIDLLGGLGRGGDAEGDVFQGTPQTIEGSGFGDTIVGADSTDFIKGLNGDDSLVGGVGADFLFGGGGRDTLDGGADFDVASYAGETSAVLVDLGAGSSAGSDVLRNIEKVVLSSRNDTLFGNAAGNIVDGDAGDDVIATKGGDDTIIGNAGADVINGGAGADAVSYAQTLDAVIINLGTGFAGGAAVGDVHVSIENLFGSEADDSLTGDDANNRLDGAAGSDRLEGGVGDDTLKGSYGDDYIDGGSGVDVADYTGETFGVVVRLFDGTAAGGALGDTIVGVENVIGSHNSDTLTGDSAANMLLGGGGGDRFAGLGGADTLVGSTLYYDLADYSAEIAGVVINLNTGVAGSAAAGDVLISIEDLVGTSANDTLRGNGAANYLAGGGGHDLIVGAGAQALFFGPRGDVLDGGAGDDTLLANGVGDATLSGGAGDDLLSATSDGHVTFVGGAGADTMRGGAPGTATVSYVGEAAIVIDLVAGVVSGAAANDVFTNISNFIGSSFADSLVGGAAASNLNGADGNDTIVGGSGGGALRGGGGNDRIVVNSVGSGVSAGGGNDIIIVNSAGSTVVGGGGDDTLLASNGADYFKGGAGYYDTISYANAAAAVILYLGGVAPNAGAAAGDTLNGVEVAIGTAFDDFLFGWHLESGLYGGAGDDVLQGQFGDDTLDGGDDDDFLFGGEFGFDSLVGGAGRDTLASYSGEDTLRGGTGNDQLTAGQGNDSLFGDAGHDMAWGGEGDDFLDGAAGDDSLNGSYGADTLVGGSGADTFVFQQQDGADTIRDFAAGVGIGDVIRLGFGALFDSFAEVLAAATDNGVDTTINFGGGDVIILRGVLKTQLAADDFTFG